MTRQPSQITLFALLFAVMCSGTLLAEAVVVEPATQTVPDDAYSKHELLPARKAFNLETIVEAYRQHGRKNPAWDKEALELLELYAIRFTYSKAFATSAYTGSLYEEEIKIFRPREELAEALQAAKCDDPMVLYLISDIYTSKGDNRTAIQLLQLAHAGFQGTDYPAYRKLACLNRLLNNMRHYRHNPSINQAYQVWAEAYLDAACASIKEFGELKNIHLKDMLIDDIVEMTDNRATERHGAGGVNFLEQFAAKLAAIEADCDPWAYHAAAGHLKIQLGWAYRGAGFAANVRPEQWRAFEAQLTEAHSHLSSAWEITPSVLVANGMVMISMAGHAPPEESERVWFDRGLDIRFDETKLWNSMFSSLKPRWGGSHEKMYKLAIECIHTGRFDTDLPYLGVTFLKTLERESAQSHYWHRQETIDALNELARGMDLSKKRKDKSAEHWYTILRAAFMWKCKAYEPAKQAIEEVRPLDEDAKALAENAFGRFGTNADSAIGEIYALSSEFSEQITQSLSDVRQGRYERAINMLTNVLEQDHKLHPLAASFLKGKLGGAMFNQRFASGEWVSLDRPEDLESSWEPVRGTWQANPQGGFLGQADEQGLILLYRHPIQGAWEISCEFEVLGAKGSDWANGGIVSRYVNENQQDGFWVFPKDSVVGVNWSQWSIDPTFKHIKKSKNVLRVRQNRNGKLLLFINEKKFSHFNVDDIRQPRRFALMSASSVLGVSLKKPDNLNELKVHYSNIKVRKLK